MQTFLPFEAFRKSAAVLDYRRLGKQRLEAREILRILGGRPSRWSNHPAVRMWQGHSEWLEVYYNIILAEWITRGYRNSMDFIPAPRATMDNRPGWLGTPEFHESHRAALLAKDPEHYSQFGWAESPEISYVWPYRA